MAMWMYARQGQSANKNGGEGGLFPATIHSCATRFDCLNLAAEMLELACANNLWHDR
jgi:hypothetical protein